MARVEYAMAPVILGPRATRRIAHARRGARQAPMTRHDVEDAVRALLSVATRDGITVFARGLKALDVELFATDGTRAHLAQDGVEVRP